MSSFFKAVKSNLTAYQYKTALFALFQGHYMEIMWTYMCVRVHVDMHICMQSYNLQIKNWKDLSNTNFTRCDYHYIVLKARVSST